MGWDKEGVGRLNKEKSTESAEVQNLEGQTTLFSDNAEYDAFTEKFKPKKTTDDCYTPPNIYAVVADWVAQEYGLDKDKFLRPFKPNGDYESETYPNGWTVVDNPPFSIMKSICTFYNERDIDFFLFCPALTPPNVDGVTIIATGSDITYENGASVSTSFVTNMQPDIVLRSAPELYKAIEEVNKINLFLAHRHVPKYEYPDHVITAAIAQKYSKRGVEYAVQRKDAVKIKSLDAQKTVGKAIFGYGWLLSDRAAADRAAADRAAADPATVWKLSEREKALVRWLENGQDHAKLQYEETSTDQIDLWEVVTK